jgi:hypothetical protein
VSGQTGYDVLAEDTAPSAIPDFLLGFEKLQAVGAAWRRWSMRLYDIVICALNRLSVIQPPTQVGFPDP